MTGAPLRHGDADSRIVEATPEVLADPDLYLAQADMDAWADAHPCGCEAICECDREEA